MMKKSGLMFMALLLAFGVFGIFVYGNAVQASGAPFVERSRIFTYGENGYDIFHQSGLVTTASGTLLAYTQGRIGIVNDSAPVDIVMKRSADNGQTWGDLQVVFSGTETAEKWGNPSLVVDHVTGDIFAFVEIPAGKELWYKKSSDDGVTWSSAVQISASVFSGSGKNANGNSLKGIQLANGRLILPIQTRNAVVTPSGYSESNFELGVLYSDDHGATWQLSGLAPAGTAMGTEFSVAQASDGSLYMNARQFSGDRRVFSRSTDNGSTWSQMQVLEDISSFRTACGTTAFPMSHSEDVLLFACPDKIKIPREDVTLWYSYDNGNNWLKGKTLNDGYSGNSDLTILPDMTIGALIQKGLLETNAWLQKNVDFMRFNLEWAIERDQPERYEAEDGVVSKAKVGKDQPALTSNGLYVEKFKKFGDYVEFEVEAAIAGTYTLDIRYANGGTKATHQIVVNGDSAGTVAYTSTGSWSTWGSTSKSVNLDQGVNKIRLSYDSNEAQLDYIDVPSRYEAEDAEVNRANIRDNQPTLTSGGMFVAQIDYTDSYVEFTVSVQANKTYKAEIRYANGTGVTSKHKMTVDGVGLTTISYPATASWTNWGTVTVNVELTPGEHKIRLAKETGFVQLDYLDLR